MADDIVAIVRASYEAYVAKDRAGIEALIAADFRFTSPLDNRIDRATYFARCWPNSERAKSFEFIHLVAVDDLPAAYRHDLGVAEGAAVLAASLIGDEYPLAVVEVYFGWDLPHEAPPGGFLDDKAD